MAKQYKLVLDIGTTGVKGFVFDDKNEVISKSYLKLTKKIFKKTHVEQSPYEILSKSKTVLKRAIQNSKINKNSFASFGLTNQRETIVAWNKTTGKPIHPAIVWEDSRTKAYCTKLRSKYNAIIQNKTGLTIEPYFSGSKMRWILDNIKTAKTLYAENNLAFGTVDSWMMWNLDPARPHVTDQTNASRTLLYNVRTSRWDKELLQIFDINPHSLPKVQPSKSLFGKLDKKIMGITLPIQAVCGDQESSTFAVGTKTYLTKITFGTGTFIVQVQPKFVLNKNFYTTIIPGNRKSLFVMEAKIEQSGSQVDKVLGNPKKLKPVIIKLAKNTIKILKLLPFQPKEIIVDGGITQSDLLLETLRKNTNYKITKQKTFDGTALGIAKLLN